MEKASHYLSMVSICRIRALEDRERRAEWLDWAKVWNELAADAFGHPLEERIATRSSDMGQPNYSPVE